MLITRYDKLHWILLTQNSVKLRDAVNITEKLGILDITNNFLIHHSNDCLASEDTVSYMTTVLRLFLHNCT